MTMADALKRALDGKGVGTASVRRGEVYWVEDKHVVVPETRAPGAKARRVHPRRPVLVIQADEDNADPLYPLVVVAPLSHSVDLKGKQDIELPQVETGLPEPSMAMLGLIQALLKRDLSDRAGKLSDALMNDVTNTLLCNLGVLPRPRN